jgi:hypothetical protein
MIGFSPRSQALTMYIDPGFPAYELLMKKLGKYTKGHSCLYIKKLEDVDMDVLKQLVTESYRSMKKSTSLEGLTVRPRHGENDSAH